METQLTLKEVLEQAIQKEIASRFLYSGLRQRVNNPSAKDALESLAGQELKHQQFLEDYLKGNLKDGFLHSGLVVDYKIADHLNQPEIELTMELKEVFQLAGLREKA